MSLGVSVLHCCQRTLICPEASVEAHWSGRPGGSGLGLAIAAELVRAHGGEIHLVEGTIGATFRIAIPDRPVELLSVRSQRARA